MTTNIQFLIINLISFGFSTFMLYAFLKPNHYFKYGLMIYSAIFVLLFFIQLVILPSPDPLLGCCWILPFYLFSLSCFQCSTKESIAAPLVNSCLFSTFFLSSMVLFHLTQAVFFPESSASADFIVFIILEILSSLASLWIMQRFSFWKSLPWWILIPCFVIFFILSNANVLVNVTLENNFVLCLITLIFANMLIVLLVWFFFEKKKRLSRSIAYIQSQQKLQLEYYFALCIERESLIAFQKESIQQVHRLQQICTSNNREEAIALLDSISERMQPGYLLMSTQNDAVDILLQNKFRLAKAQNCHLVSSLLLENSSSIDDIDLVCILANLLDNALLACQSGDTIQVSGVAQKGLLVLEVHNPFHGQQLPKRFDLPCLTANGHGSGLSSVQHTASKYGGLLSLSHNGDIITAQVTLELQ